MDTTCRDCKLPTTMSEDFDPFFDYPVCESCNELSEILSDIDYAMQHMEYAVHPERLREKLFGSSR